MSKLDDLVNQLCPDGVEYRKLGEVASYIRGITYSKTDEVDNDGYAVLRANNIDIATNTLCMNDVKHVSSTVNVSAEKRLLAGDTLICAGSGSREHVGKVAFISKSLPVNYTFGGFMGVIRAKSDIINSRFLYFVMSSSIFRDHLAKALDSTTINNINSKIINGFVIPIPPLIIQQKIVEILDKFTSLQAELQAELKLRFQQYEYYRNQLLTFDPDDPTVEWKKLGDIVYHITPPAKLHKKQYQINGDYPIIDQGQSDIVGYTNDVACLVPEGEYVLFGDHTREIKWHAGKFAQGADGLKIMQPKYEGVKARYLYYALKNADIPNLGYSRHWRVVKDIEIPIPPLTEQQRIVNILDKFSDYTTSLTNGLPAEIKLRQQQYEYYRDKLLTFRHLSPTN